MKLKIGDILFRETPPSQRSGVVVVSAVGRSGSIEVLKATGDEHPADSRWILSIGLDEIVESTTAMDSFRLDVTDRLTLDAPEAVERVGRLSCDTIAGLLKLVTLSHVDLYYRTVHQPAKDQAFTPGETPVNYAGRVFDEEEIINLVDSSLDFWLTAGSYAAEFETAFARKLGVKHCSLVNSGSSADLTAFMALTSPKLGDRRINKGDEVITVAAGFPATINPIIQYGAVPVFVDVSLPTYNIDVSMLEAALSERTKAMMLAHTLGNPFDIDAVKAFCDKNSLWLIEDNCDALGSTYCDQFTGTFGDLGTSSFYPAHHITMGEGGAVYTNNTRLKVLVESFRDWGRACFCDPGKENTCGKRFGWQLGDLPKGYDHKYIFSHFGYNLKVTDMQAAVGVAQLAKLDRFTAARQRNWAYLRQRFADLEDVFILPEATEKSAPSWFGFLLTIRDQARISRHDLLNYLNDKKIQTRLLFAGNYIRHPAFDEMRASGDGHRVIGDLANTDVIMNDTFWVGVYPGMKDGMLDYMFEAIEACVRG